MEMTTDEAVPKAPMTPNKQPAPLARVLYAMALDPAEKFGSMEEQICFLAHAFQKEDGEFRVLFSCEPGPGKTRQFEDRGVAAYCLDLKRFRFSSLRQLLRLISEHNIEVIHWNFTDPVRNAYVWWLTLLAPRLRHFYTDHTSRTASDRGANRFPVRQIKSLLLRRYAKVICVSQFVKQCLQQQRCWHNLQLLLHFINTDRFKPDPAARAEMRRKHNVEDKFLIVTVAHLIFGKGVQVLLRAMAEVPHNAECWIIGKGGDADSLYQLHADLQLGDRVRFLGLQGNVEPFLQAADCFVCPSVWEEAAGLVNIEAQAVQLPLIASRIGGIPEYVDDGKSGILFTPGNHEELAQCLCRLSDDPQLRQTMAEQARKMVLDRFSPQRMLDAFIEPYRLAK